MKAPSSKHQISNKFLHDRIVTSERLELPQVGVDIVCPPLTPTLSPAFAEAASHRQAPGEREIIELFST
jgi:hypothetical protein